MQDENGKLADYGVTLLISDLQLVAIKEGGALRRKFRTWAFPYSHLKDNVGRSEYQVAPGTKPYYVAGFARMNGDHACMAEFFEERERDAFAAVLQAAIDAFKGGHRMSESDLAQARALLR